MTATPDINTPNLTPELARLAAAMMALHLQVRLLDKNVSFEEAAKAAIRALPSLRDAAIGMIDHDAVIAVDLGEERGGRVQLFSSMEAAAADRELSRHRHVAVEVGHIVADLLTTARGKVFDGRIVN